MLQDLMCKEEQADEDQIFNVEEIKEIQNTFQLFFQNKVRKIEKEDSPSQHPQILSQRMMDKAPQRSTFGNLITTQDAKSFTRTAESFKGSDRGSQINTVVSQTRYINYSNLNLGLHQNATQLMSNPSEFPYSDSKSFNSKLSNKILSNTVQAIEAPSTKFKSNGQNSRFNSGGKSSNSSVYGAQSCAKSKTSQMHYSQMEGAQSDPILLLDINLPNGEIERFVLHKNDNVEDVVDTFVFNNSTIFATLV